MAEDVPMLKDIIRKDTEFCCYHNLMDYSLLFAVEKFSAKTINDSERVRVRQKKSGERFFVN